MILDDIYTDQRINGSSMAAMARSIVDDLPGSTLVMRARDHPERAPGAAEGCGAHGAEPTGLAAAVCHWVWFSEWIEWIVLVLSYGFMGIIYGEYMRLW